MQCGATLVYRFPKPYCPAEQDEKAYQLTKKFRAKSLAKQNENNELDTISWNETNRNIYIDRCQNIIWNKWAFHECKIHLDRTGVYSLCLLYFVQFDLAALVEPSTSNTWLLFNALTSNRRNDINLLWMVQSWTPLDFIPIWK